MFNDLVNLYCSYCDLADWYKWGSRDWDRHEKYIMYMKLAANLEAILAEMC